MAVKKKKAINNKKPAAKKSAADYPIIKGLAIPKMNQGPAKQESNYPFKMMVKGDAFFAPMKERQRVREHMKDFNRKLIEDKSALRFQTRTLKDGTIGVWLLPKKQHVK